MTTGLPVSVSNAVDKNDRQLLMELVAGINPPDEILQRFGMTKADFAAKVRDPRFLATWREIKQEWGNGNTSERARKMASFLLEDMIVDMVQATKNDGVSPAVKRDTVEALAKISDNWEPAKHKKDGALAQNVKININFGQQVAVQGQSQTYEVSSDE